MRHQAGSFLPEAGIALYRVTILIQTAILSLIKGGHRNPMLINHFLTHSLPIAWHRPHHRPRGGGGGGAAAARRRRENTFFLSADRKNVFSLNRDAAYAAAAGAVMGTVPGTVMGKVLRTVLVIKMPA